MLKAGDLIPDAAAMDTLPVGAALTVPGSRKLLTRHPDGWAQHTDGRARHTTQRAFREGMEVVSLPRIEYTGPGIGDPVTFEDLALIPEGAVLIPVMKAGQTRVPDRGYQIQRMTGGAWNINWYATIEATERRRDEWARNVFDVYDLQVHSLPDLPGETVAQFAARMRDLCLTGAQRAGGQFQTAALQILEKMGSTFEPSVGLRIINTNDRDALPVGTVVYQGNPEQPSNFGVFRKDGNSWVPVFGMRRSLDQWQALVIDVLPDADEPADWMVAAGTVADEVEIAALRAQAWKLGFKEKTDRGWCDEFERIMLRSGITKDSIVQYLTPEQVQALPIGTILWAKNADGTWGLLKRQENARNAAGTRRILGNMRGHMSDRVQVFSQAEAAVIPVESHEQMVQMPIGTIITEGTNMTNNYIKVRAGEGATTSTPEWAGAGRSRGPAEPTYLEQRPIHHALAFHRPEVSWNYIYIPGVTD